MPVLMHSEQSSLGTHLPGVCSPRHGAGAPKPTHKLGWVFLPNVSYLGSIFNICSDFDLFMNSGGTFTFRKGSIHETQCVLAAGRV